MNQDRRKVVPSDSALRRYTNFFTSLILMTLVYLKTGWNLFPNFEYMFALSANFPDLPDIDALAQYNFYSLAPYVVLSQLCFGAGNSTKLIFFIAIIFVLFCLQRVSNCNINYRFSFVILLSSPALVILLSWIGSYDVVTVGMILVVLYTRKNSWALIAGIVAAWSNFEQFLLAGVILALAMNIENKSRSRRMMTAAISSCCAYVLLRFFLYSQGVSEIRATGQMKLFENRDYFANALNSSPIVLLTIMSGSFVAIFYWVRVAKPTLKEVSRVGVGIFIIYATAMIALDQTRIGAILILPLTLLLGEKIASKCSPQQTQNFFRSSFLVALLTPPVFVWSYQLHLVGWDNLLLR
jgi:hypothetical protein